MFGREKLSGLNFNDWFRLPKMVLRVEKKLFVVEQRIPPAPPADSKYLRNEMRFIMLIMSDFAGVVRNYNMHNMRKTTGELHALLIEYEKGLPKKAATPQVMAIQGGRIQKDNKTSLNAKGKGKGKGNGKDKSYIPKPKTLNLLLKRTRQRMMPATTAKRWGILTPPYTPQHNDVFERRNHTLLDMVRFMMNLTTLLLSFWDYALETATCILNMVPTQKVDKTPYELWYGKVPNLSYLKKNLLSQEVSGRAEELKEIQDEDTSPFENTSEIPMEVEGFEPPQEEVVPVRRSARTHQAPNGLCLNVEIEEHSLGDLNEPKNYKAALLDLEYDKTLIAIAVFYDFKIWQMDVNIAFLNGYLNEDIYMVQPEASRSWNKRFDEEIKSFGFAQNLDEPCVYQKASGSNATFLILYVDDIIIMGNHIPSLQSVKTYLGKGFSIKDLGEAPFILEIKIYQDRSKRLIGLSQSVYMDEILKRFRMDTSKRSYIPMQERLDLNKTQGASTPEENLGKPHWTTVKIILKYLRNTKDMILVYGGNPEAELRVDCYCNAGFETNRDDIKSQTRYVFLNNIVASEAAMEAVWFRKFDLGLGIVPTINEPIKMFCDNSAALLIANEPMVQRGARHYHRRYHYIRECIELGEINLLKVHTDDNLADLFTKALPKGKLTQHARSIGLRLASSFM
ncbi:retrotransposon protein, putative, ty1-copia subclass [Tanacetum coccineum]